MAGKLVTKGETLEEAENNLVDFITFEFVVTTQSYQVKLCLSIDL